MIVAVVILLLPQGTDPPDVFDADMQALSVVPNIIALMLTIAMVSV